MVIKLPLPFKGSKSEEKLYALFDTGSTYSCIREDIAEKIGILDNLPEPMYFSTASENKYMKVESGMRLNFEIDDVNLTDEFMVVPPTVRRSYHWCDYHAEVADKIRF